MGGEAEAAGDALTGAVIAHAIEGQRGAAASGDGACRNCGARLGGAYCAACGQAAHIHRSLRSLGHDILHGVFHFEGRFWRTMPELLFRPGRLTRRYIDGERAKFVSPMALFLFTVFAMFAVFSLTAGPALDEAAQTAGEVRNQWRTGNDAAIEQTNRQIEALQQEKGAPEVTAERRAQIDAKIEELTAARTVMEALAAGDFERIAQLDAELDAAAAASGQADKVKVRTDITLGVPALDRRLAQGMQQMQQNQALLLYKLKINSYKFSWMLIPLSVPFLWLMFFWRRDVHLYDHAIFTTYSISFMMLLVMALAILATLMSNFTGLIWGLGLSVAPAHMYKQLRGAYGLSRAGAFVRLMLLMMSATIVLTIYFMLLLTIGALA